MKIDKTWPLSAAEQLKAQLRLAIQSGTWRAGTNLPTVRVLAAELSLNPNTVAAVYRELAHEGLLTRHRRGGTRVAPGLVRRTEAAVELLQLTDRLVQFARTHNFSGAEVLRLIAGRWSAPKIDSFGDRARHPIYDFLRRHDYDEG